MDADHKKNCSYGIMTLTTAETQRQLIIDAFVATAKHAQNLKIYKQIQVYGEFTRFK